jgi:5-methylcytosine-specific restriction endonuclease McrA
MRESKLMKNRRLRMILKHGPVCKYCNKRCDIDDLTVDHLWPKALGGKSKPENMVLSCKRCNVLKGGLPPLFFAKHFDELQQALKDEADIFKGMTDE